MMLTGAGEAQMMLTGAGEADVCLSEAVGDLLGTRHYV